MNHNPTDANPRWVGLLPASPGCDCQLCRPKKFYDPFDRKSLDTVLRHGWQVILVGAGCDHEECCDDDEALPFAYTVGLGHRSGHPELFISGLEPTLMHAVLNSLAARVMAGHTYAHGDVVEGALGHVPVVLEQIADDYIEEAVPCASWFHRRRTDALVIVWPTTSGIFSWQPGAPPSLDERQPPQWRSPSARTGGVAADPEWLLPVPPDRLAYSCIHVVEQGAPVLCVARQSDGRGGEDWTAHCGAFGHDTDDMCMTHVAHLLRGAPSIRLLSDLPMEHEALRRDVDSPWVIGEVEDE